jgi:hypothetical protein
MVDLVGGILDGYFRFYVDIEVINPTNNEARIKKSYIVAKVNDNQDCTHHPPGMPVIKPGWTQNSEEKPGIKPCATSTALWWITCSTTENGEKLRSYHRTVGQTTPDVPYNQGSGR